mgnify:FL=1
MEKITLEAVEACLKSLEITYELSQAQALVTFCETLLKWNATYNLTTITDASSVLTLHVADSLTLVPKVKEFAPAAKRVLDVGSGGGLPVVPLAVMRPDLSVSAVDTVKKKAVFLRQAGVMCRLRNFTVYNDRVEKLSVPPFDVITSRAFASLKDMTFWTEHLLAENGVWLAMKGKLTEDEMAGLDRQKYEVSSVPLSVPGAEVERHLVVIRRHRS